ncbi:hypothetical protein [Streptomyces albofaciens]|uniref:hypothetical protein n=1 Tax=Streptomyces albofaciens TaxID=66866 RepID=UPI000A838317|nr:hypothetical protein [Streptomyces albofaciens]
MARCPGDQLTADGNGRAPRSGSLEEFTCKSADFAPLAAAGVPAVNPSFTEEKGVFKGQVFPDTCYHLRSVHAEEANVTTLVADGGGKGVSSSPCYHCC